MIACDTNILIFAHRVQAPEHIAAQKALQAAAAYPGGWLIPSPCVAEFFSIVTSASRQQRASAPAEAIAFLSSLIAAGAEIALPRIGFAARLLIRCEQLGVVGVAVFDAQIALIALEAGATEIWTHDRNFTTIPGLAVHDPL